MPLLPQRRDRHSQDDRYSQGRRSTRRKSPIILVLLVVLFSILIGSILAQSISAAPPFSVAQAPASAPAAIGTVDLVTPPYQLGQQVYLETCATCHIAVPPAVLPSETWRRLLLDSEHYGQTINLPVGPPRLLMWRYLRDYSRPQKEDEELPYRLQESRFFRLLHPRVKLPRPLTLNSCATCHPGATQYNFRSLTPEWDNSP